MGVYTTSLRSTVREARLCSWFRSSSSPPPIAAAVADFSEPLQFGPHSRISVAVCVTMYTVSLRASRVSYRALYPALHLCYTRRVHTQEEAEELQLTLSAIHKNLISLRASGVAWQEVRRPDRTSTGPVTVAWLALPQHVDPQPRPTSLLFHRLRCVHLS